MQAMISKTPNRISFFRHDPKAMKGQPKCTYSDETHRHKLAKEILLRIKRVKVPALYKYPPNNINGFPNLISKPKFIEAEIVRAEIYFYENEFGDIFWNKTAFSDEDKYLLLKPDIVFFDKNEKPILLIEIVVTHKISEKKLLDLKRLGIDTIQITIPKDSPENIEKTFETTNRTKWIYNYEQEITEYIPVSDSNSEGISSIDEEQRKLFEESYKCRTAQINNLIRTITRCLESEQFRTIAEELESEISRVERNTERNRESLFQQRERNARNINDLRNEIRTRINSKHNERRKRIEFQKSDLEERYNRKRNEIITITESTEGAIREFTERFNSIDETFEREGEDIKRLTAEQNSIREFAKTEQENINREQENGNNLEEKYTRIRTELEQSFRNIRRRIGIAIETRNFENNEYTRKFKNLLIDLEKVHDFVNAQKYRRRIEQAWECIKNAAYKNWQD